MRKWSFEWICKCHLQWSVTLAGKSRTFFLQNWPWANAPVGLFCTFVHEQLPFIAHCGSQTKNGKWWEAGMSHCQSCEHANHLHNCSLMNIFKCMRCIGTKWQNIFGFCDSHQPWFLIVDCGWDFKMLKIGSTQTFLIQSTSHGGKQTCSEFLTFLKKVMQVISASVIFWEEQIVSCTTDCLCLHQKAVVLCKSCKVILDKSDNWNLMLSQCLKNDKVLHSNGHVSHNTLAAPATNFGSNHNCSCHCLLASVETNFLCDLWGPHIGSKKCNFLSCDSAHTSITGDVIHHSWESPPRTMKTHQLQPSPHTFSNSIDSLTLCACHFLFVSFSTTQFSHFVLGWTMAIIFVQGTEK